MKWKWIDADCTSVTTAEGTLTLKGLFIPLFIEQLLMNMTGTVNTLMLGHYADDAVAAVGAANQVIGFLYTFYAVFSGGASVVISHRLGAGDEKRASDAAFTSIVCGGAISLILGTILAFFAGAVMRPMQLETSVYEMAVVYFRICIGFSVLQGIISAISAVLRSYGKPKLAVTVSLFMNIVNAVLNYVVIFQPVKIVPEGVEGIAMANVASHGTALLLGVWFVGRSMYMQQRTGSFKEAFSKNTFYRFLNSSKTNWLRFTSLLAADIVNHDIRDLTDPERKNVFIIDDSLFNRTSCKKTELGSKVFDHTDMHFKKGFRMLTLSWSDGNTLIPVNSCLLASAKNTNIIGPVKDFDNRTLAGKRRALAQTKAPEAMMTLLNTALSAGLKADYVLFDSWFSNPAQVTAIHAKGMDVIAMIKKSSRIKYSYGGEQLNIKEIYSRNKKRRGRSRSFSKPANPC